MDLAARRRAMFKELPLEAPDVVMEVARGEHRRRQRIAHRAGGTDSLPWLSPLLSHPRLQFLPTRTSSAEPHSVG